MEIRHKVNFNVLSTTYTSPFVRWIESQCLLLSILMSVPGFEVSAIALKWALPMDVVA